MKEHLSSLAEAPAPADLLTGTGPILPDQYFTRSRVAAGSGVHRLFAAVLTDGVQLYCETCRRKDPEGRRIAEETEAWVESNDRTHLFSFLNLCNVLDVDAASLRLRLRRWRAGRDTHSPAFRRL